MVMMTMTTTTTLIITINCERVEQNVAMGQLLIYLPAENGQQRAIRFLHDFGEVLKLLLHEQSGRFHRQLDAHHRTVANNTHTFAPITRNDLPVFTPNIDVS